LKGQLIALRYVRPLLDIASDHGVADKVGEELLALHNSLTQGSQFSAFLLDPSVSHTEKKLLLDKALQSGEAITRDFLKVLIDKGRPEIILSAYSLYSALLREKQGIFTAIVETAMPIKADTQLMIKTKLEKEFNKKLQVEYKVTPAIIGGLRIQIGNVLLDRSVSGSLSHLKKIIAGD